MTEPVSTIDRFAEALSEHDAFAKPPYKAGSVAKAAQKIGVSRQSGYVMLSRIRARLGWQAV